MTSIMNERARDMKDYVQIHTEQRRMVIVKDCEELCERWQSEGLSLQCPLKDSQTVACSLAIWLAIWEVLNTSEGRTYLKADHWG